MCPWGAVDKIFSAGHWLFIRIRIITRVTFYTEFQVECIPFFSRFSDYDSGEVEFKELTVGVDMLY